MSERNFMLYSSLRPDVRRAVKADMLRAKGNCKHCYGTGLVGVKIDGPERRTVLCRCVVVDMDIFANSQKPDGVENAADAASAPAGTAD